MPAHKRALPENATDEDSVRRRHHHHHAKPSRVADPELEGTSEEEEEDEESRKQRIKGEDDDEYDEEEAEEEREDSDGSPSSSSDDKPEYVYVELAEVRKDVQCPICLGIIKKTRTVMECLHRFCRECIDKSMRLGNNECPACRTHCASRRSLRDDPNFDALIATLYPDIDKYEEEELAFHEEEKTRNKQIQASIAQIFQRQSEALSKRRTMGKDPVGGFIMTRPQRNVRTALARRKRNSRGTEPQGSDDNEDENVNSGAKDSSSTDERIVEFRPRKQRKRTGARSSRPSSADGGCAEHDTEVTRETRGISPGLVWNPEMLAWGRGGTRSNTRHGGANGSGKNSRNTRLSKLVEHLRNTDKNIEVDVHFMLISLDIESTPSLKLPHLCSQSSLSVRHLREYIAQQTPLQADEVELLVVKSNTKTNESRSTTVDEYGLVLQDIVSSISETHLIGEKETLAGIQASYSSTANHLILGYRKKRTAPVS